MLIVDTHPHIFADDLEKYPAIPLGGVQSEWSKGRHLTGEEFLAKMDAAGVTKSAVVQSASVHGYDNSYAADQAARYPDRLISICCIDPRTPDVADTLSYWVEERNMKGTRLSAATTVGHASWFDDESLDPFWERARELAIPVSVHIGFDELRPLRNVMERFPDIQILLDHIGYPPIQNGSPFDDAKPFFALSSYHNLVLKLTNSNLTSKNLGHAEPTALVEAIVAEFGANRVMWGSNFPNTSTDSQTPYSDLVATMMHSVSSLSEEDRSWLLGKTALAVFPALQ